ncbi:MAG: mitofilin family membrane protein [Magnetospirillum sp. WYHS-4]
MTEASNSVPTGPTQRPAPPRGRRRSGLGRLVAAIAVIATLGAVAHATFPVWWPKLESRLEKMGIELDGVRDPRVAGLADRVTVLEEMTRSRLKTDAVQDLEAERARFSKDIGTVVARMEALEAAVSAVRRMADAQALQPGSPAEPAVLGGEDLPAIKDRLARLEESAAGVHAEGTGVQAEQARAELVQAVAQLSQRLASLEQAKAPLPPPPPGSARALVLAVGQLREALRAGHPYLEHLEALKVVAPPAPVIAEAVAVLEPPAATGVPTLETLRRRFEDMAAVMTRPAVSVPGTESWVDKTMTSLSSLVTVRRTGDAPQLGAAREALAREDLAGAIRAIQELADRPAEAAAPWLAEARARFTADEALAALHNHAIALAGQQRE